MGIIIWPHQNKTVVFKNEQGNSIYRKNNYTNKKAVSNVIHDITRTRENERQKRDLLNYGAVGCGCMIPADDMIQEFLYVQNAYGIEARKGKRMYHEIFSLLDEEVRGLYYNPYYLYEFALECAKWYYDQGFQVVFAIHHQSKFHIHFAVNSINFRTGLKFHTSKIEKTKREQLFNWILQKHMRLLNFNFIDNWSSSCNKEKKLGDLNQSLWSKL